MRIIRGKYKSKRITAPKQFNARPTTDFAKEGLFNLIDNEFYYEKLNVLDLFSGTGNITYEFLSRGAKNVTLVEKNRRYAAFIEKTANTMFPDQARVVVADVFKYLEKAPLNYDIIFADPPYDLENIENLPNLVFASENIKENCLFILEHSEKYSFAEHPHFEKEKKYGKVRFSFFRENI